MIKNLTKQRVYVAGAMLLLGGATYATIIYPMNHAEEYRKIQDEVRQGMDREQIQPGGMRMWSDPFKDREKEQPLYLRRNQKDS